MLASSDKLLLHALGGHTTIAAQVFACLCAGSISGDFDEHKVAKAAGLSSAQETTVLQVLRDCEGKGWLIALNALSWRLNRPPSEFARLALLLEAVGFYQEEVHRDATETSVVLTRPARPSQLEDALLDTGWKAAELESTAEAFWSLAASARSRVVVMTPFLDPSGAAWLLALLARAEKGTELVVILRYLSDPTHSAYPNGYDTIAANLRAINAKVYDYALPRPDNTGIETFHAKVVLADWTEAYVGSSNMNKASLERSVEMGVLIKGNAARSVAVVIDAILKIAKRVI